MAGCKKVPQAGRNYIAHIYQSNPSVFYTEIRRLYNDKARELGWPIIKSDSSIVNYLVLMGLCERSERALIVDRSIVLNRILVPNGMIKQIAQQLDICSKTVADALSGKRISQLTPVIREAALANGGAEYVKRVVTIK